MTYQIINNIDDLFPFVEESGITIKTNEEYGYKHLQYDVLQECDFDKYPLLKECRGIKFNMNGDVIARPFHKFFNLGQHEALDIDLSKPHIIEEKFDGSMIHTCVLNGKIRLMTKRGITDISHEAEDNLTQEQIDELNFLKVLLPNSTHIFEFCSRMNKVVIDYPEPKLIYLDSRHNITGEYLHVMVEDFESIISKTYQNLSHIPSEGHEGVVLRFNDGERVKVKTEWYLKRHRVVSHLSERNILHAICDEYLDDILIYLDDDQYEKVKEYESELIDYFNKSFHVIFHVRLTKFNRKEFFVNGVDKLYDSWKIKYFFSDKKLSLKLIIEDFQKIVIGGVKPDTLRNHGYKLPEWKL